MDAQLRALVDQALARFRARPLACGLLAALCLALLPPVLLAGAAALALLLPAAVPLLLVAVGVRVRHQQCCQLPGPARAGARRALRASLCRPCSRGCALHRASLHAAAGRQVSLWTQQPTQGVSRSRLTRAPAAPSLGPALPTESATDEEGPANAEEAATAMPEARDAPPSEDPPAGAPADPAAAAGFGHSTCLTCPHWAAALDRRWH